MAQPRKRILKGSWLQSYRRYIVKQESPDIFHFWVGVSLITAAMRRNVYVDRNAYEVYPNQYIFLIGKSGCKKSAAMEIGLDLIHNIEGINTVHGRATVEGLIDSMSRASEDPSGKIKPDGSILLHADELAYLFGKASYITDLISFLTSAYTAKARLDFLTRTKGLAKVRNPCPTIITSTTPEQMGEIFPSAVLSSGFIARILLVFGEAGSRVAEPILNRDMKDSLIHDLGCVSQMCGEMVMTPEAKSFFNTWYEEMPPTDRVELESFYGRKHDHVLKTAMVLSAAESDKMILTIEHINAAIMAIDNIETRRIDALDGIGASIHSILTDQVYAYVKLHHPAGISHSLLLRRVYKRLTRGGIEFKEIIESLKDQRAIMEEASPKGIFYKLWKKR
jgi:hypothetical protein